MPHPRKPGPKGPDKALIQAILELKSRNPRFGCPRIAHIISLTFGVDVDKTFAGGHTVAPADLNNVRWVSHCRDLVQLPVAA
jgi:hypothetical protein